MDATREPITEVATCTASTTITDCRSDSAFVLSAMLGAALGAVLGVLLAPHYPGGEYAELCGALGAMLGSWALAAVACVSQRTAVPASQSEPVIPSTTGRRLAG